MNGEIMKEETQTPGRQVFPRPFFQSVEVLKQRSGVNLGRIIVQGKEAAYVGEQLQAGGGLRLFGRKDSVKRQQGIDCASTACGPGDGQQGHESAKARA